MSKRSDSRLLAGGHGARLGNLARGDGHQNPRPRQWHLFAQNNFSNMVAMFSDRRHPLGKELRGRRTKENSNTQMLRVYLEQSQEERVETIEYLLAMNKGLYIEAKGGTYGINILAVNFLQNGSFAGIVQTAAGNEQGLRP